MKLVLYKLFYRSRSCSDRDGGGASKSPWIELHTGAYANAITTMGRDDELEILAKGAN